MSVTRLTTASVGNARDVTESVVTGLSSVVGGFTSGTGDVTSGVVSGVNTLFDAVSVSGSGSASRTATGE